MGSWFARRDPDSLVDGAPLFFSGERPLLRYGENPHQSGGIRLYFEREDEFALRGLDDLSKDTLSYNNLVDANAAFELCSELARASRERLLLLWSGRDCGEGGDPEGSTKLCFGWQQEANANRSPTIRKEVFRYRKLPHWQLPGAYYWVTFASAIGDLTEDERDIVMSAIRYWDGKKIDLFAAVVMRDHVHMLLAPSEVPGRPGEFFDL